MFELPASLPSCGHGVETSTYLLLSCQSGYRHHAACAQALDELRKLFEATGTSIRLKTCHSGISQYNEKTRKYEDVLPPSYSLSLGCNGPFQPLASQSGRVLNASQLLAFISETLKGGKQ